MPNPFVLAEETDIETDNQLPLYKEYAYDFEKDKLIYENGKNKIVTENEALKIWIYKALKTERYKYIVYDNAYGMELEKFIGTHTNNNKNATLIKSYIIQTLMINPYIISIDKLDIDIVDDKLSYTIYLNTIYGKLYDKH